MGSRNLMINGIQLIIDNLDNFFFLSSAEEEQQKLKFGRKSEAGATKPKNVRINISPKYD